MYALVKIGAIYNRELPFSPATAAFEIYSYQNKTKPEDIHGLIFRRVDAPDAENVG